MSAPPDAGQAPNYFSRLVALTASSVAQLARPPSSSRRAVGARRLVRQSWPLIVASGAAVLVLIYAFDAKEIGLMPPRGTPGLWPARVVTYFGKASLVLWILAVLMVVVAVISPVLQGPSRSRLLRLGTRLEFAFFAVLVPVLAGEAIKWIVGRGRPFVGGEANVLKFDHFAGTEAYASFPSAHAITSAALAFAVSAVWPQARIPIILYAIAIAGSRLVLLAHHPSDVVAGALIGVVGAMCVRYWFAGRRLGFLIGPDGRISPSAPSPGDRKRVARAASAP